MLAVVFLATLLIGGITGTGNGGTAQSNSASSESGITSKSELCSAYRAVHAAHSDLTGTKDLGPPLVRLAEVAQNYPDSSVRREGRNLSRYSENVIYVEGLPAKMNNIRFECR